MKLQYINKSKVFSDNDTVSLYLLDYSLGIPFPNIPHKKLSYEFEKESLPVWKINGVGIGRKLLPETTRMG